ncbi:MAG: acetylxylan esterase [Bacteroidales bacterium]|nr:acetylxylan esterase [Bacteroidales bacterium]
MSKKFPFFRAAAFLAAAMVLVCNCNPVEPEPEPEPEVDPEDLVALKGKVPVTQNWVFDSTPSLTIQIDNPNKVKVTADISVKITTDIKKKTVGTVETSVEVPANGSLDVNIATDQPLEPGFYTAACRVNKKHVRTFTFGINPFDIVSAPDKQADFDSFWDDAKAELATIDMNATLTELPAFSGTGRKVYFVEMNSIPDGPGGDPVVVRGYYCEPVDGKKHPVIMHFFGYDDQKPSGKLWVPYGGSSSDYSEFYLSHRGQYINNRKASQREDGLEQDFTNIYGDWFAFNFGQKDAYYYRGAFLDCVQAIRFMATRSTSDMNNVFAEGMSQGGALSYAAAALSEYPLRAIAPAVAFLGDYPDYFNIVTWPGNTAKASKGSMTDEEMYTFLSYFDTKNLATRINCSVIACSSLQDGTCPPHTNLAPFNNLKNADKIMVFNPELQHTVSDDWTNEYMTFFKERIK